MFTYLHMLHNLPSLFGIACEHMFLGLTTLYWIANQRTDFWRELLSISAVINCCGCLGVRHLPTHEISPVHVSLSIGVVIVQELFS